MYRHYNHRGLGKVCWHEGTYEADRDDYNTL